MADADAVERFLDDAVQGLAGESGEVDRDVLSRERALDIGTDADRGSGHGVLAQLRETDAWS